MWRLEEILNLCAAHGGGCLLGSSLFLLDFVDRWTISNFMAVFGWTGLGDDGSKAGNGDDEKYWCGGSNVTGWNWLVWALGLWYHVENLNLIEIIIEINIIERDEERKRMEVRVFQVVRLYEPMSTWCSQWATSLLYSLYDVIWMITMCCEVSYLYIGLLTQLSYLTYVGFFNIPPQTQGVILMKPLSLFTKE